MGMGGGMAMDMAPAMFVTVMFVLWANVASGALFFRESSVISHPSSHLRGWMPAAIGRCCRCRCRPRLLARA